MNPSYTPGYANPNRSGPGGAVHSNRVRSQLHQIALMGKQIQSIEGMANSLLAQAGELKVAKQTIEASIHHACLSYPPPPVERPIDCDIQGNHINWSSQGGNDLIAAIIKWHNDNSQGRYPQNVAALTLSVEAETLVKQFPDAFDLGIGRAKRQVACERTAKKRNSDSAMSTDTADNTYAHRSGPEHAAG